MLLSGTSTAYKALTEIMSTLKLTKSSVDATVERGYYWDTELRGFGLLVNQKSKSYIVQARINGKEARVTVGRHGIFTAEQARKRAKEMLLQMSTGVDPRAAEKASREAGITLDEVFNAYLKHRPRLAPRTIADYTGYMNRYFVRWKQTPLLLLTADMVQQQHLYIAQQHGQAQANVAFRFLRAVINYAQGIYSHADGSPLIAVNPTKRLSAAGQWFPTKRRTNYIKEEQLGAWYSAVMKLCPANDLTSDTTMQDYLLFLMFTGLRRDEASKIEWKHVDMEGKRYVLPAENTKNRTETTLPLTSFTYALLRKRFDSRTSDFVFPGNGRTGRVIDPRFAIKKVTATSGIEFRPHDLRRSYATYASTKISDSWTVKRLMNHHTGQDITQRYLQGIERLREPAQRVTDYMLELAEQ